MDISVLNTAIVFAVVFLATIFSGMSGGGGGLIIVPFLIAVGLTPQQAIATTKFSGIGFSFGGIAAFKKKSFNNPLLLTYMIILAIFISLLVPTLFKALSGNAFQIAIGILMIANAIQRIVALALNSFIVISLILATNFIVWQYAIVGIVAATIGGYIGSNVALKRGEHFAKYVLAIFMLIAGIMLIVDSVK
jgi:uncharacterized membrane protein YfcA